MAAQPQPPQQPIYPNDLAIATDRIYARIVNLIDARLDGMTAQMRVDKQETIERDTAIAQESLQRDQELAKLVLNFREETRSRISALESRIGALEADIADTKRYLVAIAKALNIQEL